MYEGGQNTRCDRCAAASSKLAQHRFTFLNMNTPGAQRKGIPDSKQLTILRRRLGVPHLSVAVRWSGWTQPLFALVRKRVIKIRVAPGKFVARLHDHMDERL